MPGTPEQLGFDFASGGAGGDGLNHWHEQRQAAIQELARKLGLPLDRKVEAYLKDGTCLRGILHLARDELLIDPKRDLTLLLRIDRCTFTPTEIESCVRLD